MNHPRFNVFVAINLGTKGGAIRAENFLKKKLYLREIKKDITYFRTSYKRANLQVDISGLDQDQAARKVIEAVEDFEGNVME